LKVDSLPSFFLPFFLLVFYFWFLAPQRLLLTCRLLPSPPSLWLFTICLFFRCLPMSFARLCITCSFLAHLCIACSSHVRLRVTYLPTCHLFKYPPNLFFLFVCSLLPCSSPTFTWDYLFPLTYLCRFWNEKRGGQLPLRYFLRKLYFNFF
jgi:hypothetical protein